MVDETTACLVVSYPDFFGRMFDLDGLAGKVHEKGALLVVHTNPIALGIFRSPGSFGADIVTAEGQPLGIPLSFGGPYLGIFACREELVRRMPGRLVGETVDREGRRGYVLTLNTREQHIRREKATSNICTNQGLMALRAAIYLAAVGKQGLRKIAGICHSRAEYAAGRIGRIKGFSVVDLSPAAARFHEFVVRTEEPAKEVILRASGSGVLPGIDLGRFYPELDHALLVCVTEMQTKADIDRLAGALS